jgi:hypothetical protein
MAAYFLLHGACRVAEEWRLAAPARLPRPLATLLVRVFVAGTSSWLVLATVCREGRGEMLLREPELVAAFLAAPIESCWVGRRPKLTLVSIFLQSPPTQMPTVIIINALPL